MPTAPVPLVTLAVVVVGALTTTTHARAFTCAGPLGPFSVFPLDGAVEIPTNARVFVGSVNSDCQERFGVVDGSGVPVPTEGRPVVTRHGVLCVLTPAASLAPQTTYDVVVSPPYATADDGSFSSFTTGDGPDTIPPDVPRDVSSSVTTHGLFSLTMVGPGPPKRSATITFTPAADAFTLAMLWPGVSGFDDVEDAVSATVGDEILLSSNQCDWSLSLPFMGSKEELSLFSVDAAGNMSAPVDVTLVAPPPFMTCRCVVGVGGARASLAGLLVAAIAIARLRRRREAPTPS